MFFEDFLKDIHRNIIEEAKKKRKPHPSRLRGRGVEVSKTLFYKNTLCKVYFGAEVLTAKVKQYIVHSFVIYKK